jgi:hypothetical protein
VRIVRNVIAVVVTFAFCAISVIVALWVINRWERQHKSESHATDVER